MHCRAQRWTLAGIVALCVAGSLDAEEARRSTQRRGSVDLTPCPVPGGSGEMLCGSYEVPENRSTGRGRRISLKIAVLPARKSPAKPDPIFFIAGGPGDNAVRWAAEHSTSWMRKVRDVVVISNGGSNPPKRWPAVRISSWQCQLSK